MTARMYDLKWEINYDRDSLRLEQDAGCGEVAAVDLHVVQLKLLAEQAGLMSLAAPSQTSRCTTLERRFRIVAAKLKEVALDDGYRLEILERCGSGLEYLISLDNVLTLTDEFLNDLDITGPPAISSPSYPADTGGDEMFHFEVTCDEDDGTVNIYQTQVHGSGGSDEHVTLHPLQAAWLGHRLLAMARNETPAAITVTHPTPPEAPKPGRPPTGNALSNAERPARHQDKQAQLSLEQLLPAATAPAEAGRQQ